MADFDADVPPPGVTNSGQQDRPSIRRLAAKLKAKWPYSLVAVIIVVLLFAGLFFVAYLYAVWPRP